MLPVDSCYYILDNGKTMMNVFRNGEHEVIEPDLSYCFVPSHFTIPYSMGKAHYSDLRTIDTDESLKMYTFKIPTAVKIFRGMIMGKLGAEAYEADIKFNNRWMLDNKILCGDYTRVAALDTEEDDSMGMPNPKVCDEKVTAYGLYYKGQRYTWSGPEKESSQGFADFLTSEKIQMLVGWNSWGWDRRWITKAFWRNNINFDLRSIRIVDAMNIYRFTKGKGGNSRYSLEYLGEELFGEHKPFVDQRISSLPDSEKEERVGWDAEMTWKIDQKLGLSKLAVVMGKMSYRFPDDVLSVNEKYKKLTITPFIDNLLLERAREIGYVLPCKREYEREAYKGGLNYIWQNGIYDDVMQFDANSMYPNMIIAYNIAPYGKTSLLVPLVKRLLEMKETSRDDPVKYWAAKVAVNAIYGVMASRYYRLRARDVAESITSHAREILGAIREFLDGMGYRVLYQDTDSVFVKVNDASEREMLEAGINKFVVDRFGITNLNFKFEAEWVTIGFPRGTSKKETKKRYYGLRTGKKKLEVVGLEIVRGDAMKLLKEVQNTVLHYNVFKANPETVDVYLDRVVKYLYEGRYDSKLILSKNISKPIEEYGRDKSIVVTDLNGETRVVTRKIAVPQHVRALKEAMDKGWIPTETAQYGVVKYMMVKGGKPRLAHLVKHDDIDYNYYITHQLMPMLYRTGVITDLVEARRKFISAPTQTTLY